jgi:hypothetical protein
MAWLLGIVARLFGAYVGGPAAFDVGQNRPDVSVRQDVFAGWHMTAKATRCRSLAALLNDLKEQAVGMMPGMASLVMWWRRVSTGGEGTLPVWLAFEVDSMTDSAMAFVYSASCGRQHGVGWVG